MSGIEDRAKPFLTKLMLGQDCNLNKSDIEAVASWFALRTMVFEFTGNPKSRTTTKADYDYIKTNRLAPPHWRIWIGYHDSADWVMRMYNLPTVQIFQSELPSYIESGKPHKTNVLTTSIGLGSLFAYVCFTNAPKLLDQHNATVDNFRTDLGHRVLFNVWPYSQDIVWPHNVLLDTSNLDYIANFINDASKPVPVEFRDAISVHEETHP